MDFLDEVSVCGVTLRRLTLPNGKRVFEEEGIVTLMLGDGIDPPTPDDRQRFVEFTRPRVEH